MAFVVLLLLELLLLAVCLQQCKPTHVEPREGDCSFVFDASLAKQQLGWEPKVPLSEGMDLTIAFERQRCGV